MIKKLAKCINVFYFLFFCISLIGQSPQIFTYGLKTKFNQTITYRKQGGSSPAYVALDGKIIFQSPRDSRDEYTDLVEAGYLSSTGMQNVGKDNDRFTLRWVVKTWGLQNIYYVIDFTSKTPAIAGPFNSDTKLVGDDDVKIIYWGKTYAKIVFNSQTFFYYEYKTKKIFSENEW